MCSLTNLGDYDPHQATCLYSKARLFGIDNFFQRVPAQFTFFSAATAASRGGRTWHRYSPYNPVTVKKSLDIHRVIVDVVEVGRGKKTIAMRLGIAEDVVILDNILCCAA
jgi:hypothetical protein